MNPLLILTWANPAVDQGHWLSNVVDAGTRDARGRLCGSSASIQCVAGIKGWERVAATPWALSIHTHRDGRGFGAIPRRTWFATLEEAQAAAVKKVAAALKSAARKAAKGVGRQWAKTGGAS